MHKIKFLDGKSKEFKKFEYADLKGANLRCLGKRGELHTLQLNTWTIGIWKDIMQIGCERHSIKNWFS